jgi:hypothetical protein
MVLNTLEPAFSGTWPLVGGVYVDDSATLSPTRDVECLDVERIMQ